MKFTIKSEDLANAGIVASTIKKKLKSLNIENSIVRKVAISVYEAEINVVIHSKGGHAEYDIEKGYITITFTDCGPGIDDIPQALSEGWSTASDYARGNGFGAGMGLPNIKALSDEFNLISSPDGTILKIGFYI